MFQIIKNADFSYLNELLKKDFFSFIDLFFAETINPKNENEAIFLAYLFLVSRCGYISLKIDNKMIYPRPEHLHLEKEYNINEIELVKKIISGAETLPGSICSSTDEDFPKKVICKYKNYYYLQKNYVFETKVIKNFKELINQKPNDIFNEELFNRLLDEEKTLLLKQKSAIKNVYENAISLLLGGPGCGKTYLCSHLVSIFSKSLDSSKKQDLKILATSFTGKATSHLKMKILEMATNIDIEAKTLHMLLKLKEGKTKLFDDKKADYDLILVDEASMVDIRLMAYFLQAIKNGTRVVFIGDSDQLPPIEGGNVFIEISKCSKIKTTILTTAMRFENNVILKLASCIKNNDELSLNQMISQINFYDLNKLNNIKDKIFQHVEKNYFKISSEKYDIQNILKKLNRFQILSALKKGNLGVDYLNQMLFHYFYKQAKIDQFFYIPIIITKNNYKLHLFNGHMGVVMYKKTLEGLSVGEAFFKIDEDIKRFPLASLGSYDYAFAISIHKSQGSEFETSFVILPDSSQYFGKELLYTAVTRTKKSIHLCSSKKILSMMIKKSLIKNSALLERLISEDSAREIANSKKDNCVPS